MIKQIIPLSIIFTFSLFFLAGCGDTKDVTVYLLDEPVCQTGPTNYWENDLYAEAGELYCGGYSNNDIYIDGELQENCTDGEFCYNSKCVTEGNKCEIECIRKCRPEGDTVMVCYDGKWVAEIECAEMSECDRGQCMTLDAKPNIYLYPLQTTDVSVKLDIIGKGITESAPEYNEGWNVSVEPSGLIDGKYRYLFYEAMTVDEWQKKSGWVVAKGDLEKFFRSSLQSYSFTGLEIEDFIEWWIPRLIYFPYYQIFPQERSVIDKIEKITINPQPDAIQRIRYAIRGSNTATPLTEPVKSEETIQRTGKFTVFEWGVILLN